MRPLIYIPISFMLISALAALLKPLAPGPVILFTVSAVLMGFMLHLDRQRDLPLEDIRKDILALKSRVDSLMMGKGMR